MASKSVGLLNIVFGADLRGFERAMKKAQKNLKKFGSSMKRVGGTLTRSVTMPLLAVGGASVKMALDFEKSMTKVNTLVGVSKKEVESLKKQVLELSGKTATAPNELADGLYFLTSAGLSGADAMEALEQVSKGVASGLGESADLANVAAAAQNAYGKETMSASKALDIFGGMVKTGMFNAADLSKVLGTQLGLAASLGIEFEEVGAMISTYTKTTGDANSATTGLSGVMMSFAKITPKQESALEAVGLSVDELRESLSKKGLQATLLEMQKRFAANGVELSEFFSKSQALKAVLGVLGNQTETYKAILDDLSDSVGFVDKAFDETSKTSAFKMEKAMNDLKVAGTLLGQELFPIVDMLASKLTKLANLFTNLSDEGKKSAVTWAAVAAAIGPVLMMIGQMSIGISALIPLFTKLGKVMLANPYLTLAAAITAIGLAAFKATSNYNEFADVMGAVNDANKTAEKSIVEQKMQVEDLTKVLKDENTTLEDKEKALRALNLLAPEYYGKLTASKIDVEKLDTATKNYIDTLRQEARAIAAKEKMIEIEKKILDEGEKLKNQLPKGFAGAAIGQIEKQLVGSTGWERTVKRINDLKKQSEELSKVLKDFPEEDEVASEVFENIELPTTEEGSTSGGKKTTTEGITPMPVLELAPPKVKLPDFKPYGDMTRNEWERLMNDMDAEYESTSKTIEEQTAHTVSTIVEDWQKGMDKVKTVLNSIGGFMSALNQKQSVEFDMWKEQQDEKAEMLDEQLEKDIERIENSSMSEERKRARIDELESAAAAKKETLDKNIEKREREMKRKQAVRDKAMGIVNAIISTAEAVMGAVAASPLTGGMPWSAIVAGLGAAQVATIASTPIPFAQGGLVSGPVLAQIGEGSGTSAFNPEVVSPLDKLMRMMGGNRVDVHGRIEGENIVLVSDKATLSRERFI